MADSPSDLFRRPAEAISAFIDDWRGSWLSLLCGVALLFAFSQAWQAPLFGYTTDQASSGALIRYFYYPFYAGGLYLAWAARRRLIDSLWRTPLILILTGLCLLSVLWSIDPSGTIRRWIALFMTVLAGYCLAARFSWARLSEVVGVAFGIMAAGSLVLAIVFPQMGRMQELFVGAWRGMWMEKNNLGAMMALGAVAAVAAGLHNPSRRWLWWVTAAVMVVMILLSTSKTALMAALIGAGAMGFIAFSRKGPITGIVLLWLAACVMLGLAAFILFAPDHIFLLLGKDATLTGRTNIWDGISRVMQARPWLGYGYGVVWTDEDTYAPLAKITQVAGFRAYHAHSCWYEVWLALGVVGVVVWALVFTEVWIKALYRSYRGDGGYFALPMIAIYSLSSLTESMALGWNDVRWCLFVMVLVKLSLKDDTDA